MPAKKNTPAKPVKKLNKSQMRRTKGGRKAGGTQQEYLVVTMNDATVTGVAK